MHPWRSCCYFPQPITPEFAQRCLLLLCLLLRWSISSQHHPGLVRPRYAEPSVRRRFYYQLWLQSTTVSRDFFITLWVWARNMEIRISGQVANHRQFPDLATRLCNRFRPFSTPPVTQIECILHIHWVPKNVHFLFLIPLSKNYPILVILTLPKESQKKSFSTVLLVHTSDNILYLGRKQTGINVSQGSVATHARWRGLYNNDFTANFPRDLPVKQFWKSVKMWQNYAHEFVAPLFGPLCKYLACKR